MDSFLHMQAEWPLASGLQAPAATEAGSSLDRGPLQALREQMADNTSLGSTTSTDHAAQPGYPAAADSSLSATVAGNSELSGNAASSGREKLAGATGKPQPPQKSSSGAIDVALSEDHIGAAASSRTGIQGADWQLSTLSKRLSSRKSKSASLVRHLISCAVPYLCQSWKHVRDSSEKHRNELFMASLSDHAMLLPAQLKAMLLLRACHDSFQGIVAWCCVQEWIHPLVLLRRMNMSIARERPQGAHRQSQPDTQISAAPAGNACSPEVPDLEMGLLPHPKTDSASALNSNAVKLEKTSPERCVACCCSQHIFLCPCMYLSQFGTCVALEAPQWEHHEPGGTPMAEAEPTMKAYHESPLRRLADSLLLSHQIKRCRCRESFLLLQHGQGCRKPGEAFREAAAQRGAHAGTAADPTTGGLV